MVELIFYTGALYFSLFFLGFGITTLILPKNLSKFSLWLSPATLVVFLSVFLTILSLVGIPLKYVTPVIFVLLTLTTIYSYLFKNNRLKINYLIDGLLFIVILTSIFINLAPLRHARFLTSVSLGNTDALVYASVPDYLVGRSIADNLLIKPEKVNDDPTGIMNMIVSGFRWGSPAVIAFFESLLSLQGYQIAYIFPVIIFALTIPLGYILFSLFYRPSHYGALIIAFMTAFNADLLYMLYHNFTGQVFFWLLQSYLYVFVIAHFKLLSTDKTYKSVNEILIGIIIASVFLSYHEGGIFIIFPLVFYICVTFILHQRYFRFIESLLKILSTAFIISVPAIFHAIKLDIAQASNIGKPIGWALFREQTPFAYPFEFFGFHSMHNYPPLSLFLSIILSILTLIIFCFGIKNSKMKVMTFGIVIIYGIFIFWSTIFAPNFFVYNRTITFSLPILIIFLSIGLVSILNKLKKFKFLLLTSLLLLVIYNGVLMNKRFIRESKIVGRDLISISELSKNTNISGPIFLDGFYSGKINYWRDIWLEYFLYPKLRTVYTSNQIFFNVPTETSLILQSKDMLTSPARIHLENIVWENSFYRLGNVCISDNCLTTSNTDYSRINFNSNCCEDMLLLEGWDVSEPEGRWANAKVTTIRLISKSSPTTLTYTARTLEKPQHVKIYMDEILIGEDDLEEEFLTYRHKIQPSYNKKTIHHLRFEFENQYSPVEIGLSLDNRKLSAAFKEIGID